VGKFYIANPSSTFADYKVNGGSLTTCRPFSPGPNPPPFTPYFVFASIEKFRDSKVIGYGDNTLSVTFRDSDKDDEYTFSFSVPQSHSTLDDLIGFVQRGWLTLMTKRGMALLPNPLNILGVPPPPPNPVP
jgi:hypothetical protein